MQYADVYKINQSLDGSYKTKLFIHNKDTLSPLTADSARWNKMLVSGNYMKITTAADSSTYYKLEIDTIKKTMLISSYTDTTAQYQLSYSETPEKLFLLSGQFKKDTISAYFKKKTIKEYRLVNRGFHWINESPYNR